MPFDCNHLRTLRDSQRTKYSDLLLGETRVIFRSDIAFITKSSQRQSVEYDRSREKSEIIHKII